MTPIQVIHGLPMSLIPYPEGPVWVGIDPVTNTQWEGGIAPFMNEGARYGLLDFRNGFGIPTVSIFSNYPGLLVTVGQDNVPRSWNGEAIWLKERRDVSIFKLRPTTSGPGFDGPRQPAVTVSWAEAAAWALLNGFYLLTGELWEWIAQGGEDRLPFPTGRVFGRDNKRLIHCSVGTPEHTTVAVDDPRFPKGPYDLRQLAGNVWEWVAMDSDREYPFGKRGGSYLSYDQRLLRSDYRDSRSLRGLGDDSTGFRVGARDPLTIHSPIPKI